MANQIRVFGGQGRIFPTSRIPLFRKSGMVDQVQEFIIKASNVVLNFDYFLLS